MERYMVGDYGWKGMNTRLDPARVPPGYAKEITNYSLGMDGVLRKRPGYIGMLSSKQNYPIYGLSLHRSATDKLLWSSNSKLWYASVGGTTATDVTGTLTVSSAGVNTARWGKYLYGVDGTNAMFRWDGTASAATAVSGLTTPSTAISVSLGAASTLVSDITTISNYSQPYAMDAGNYGPTDLITARNFEGSSGTTISSPWNADAGQPTIKTATSTSGNVQYVELDYNGGTTAKEYMITNALTVPDESGNLGAKLYVFEAYAWSKNGVDTAQVLEAQVRLYTDSGSTLISGTDTAKYSNALNPTTPSKVRILFDHRNVTSDPLSCKLRIGAPNATTGSGGAGVNVNRVSLISPKQEFKLISSAGSLLVNQGTVQVWDGSLLTAGLRIYSTSISNQVWTGKTQVWFDMNVNVDVSGLSLRFMLKSGSTWYQGGMLFKDPAGGYVADLTQFSSTVLADVDGFGFEFLDDIVVTGIVDNGNANLLTINGIKEGGNLSNGYTYTYRFSEWDGTSITVSTYESSDGSESSGSPISADVTTSAGARTATLTIPARANAVTDQYLIWREGGVYDDGRYRLVGVATSSASATTFTDTASDASLFDRPIYQIGRDQFPSGLTCVAVHQGRLWAAKGNTIYVSWVLKEGKETGVYTTTVPDPDDPYIGIKGASFTLDTSTNSDNIKALIPMGTTMVVLREDTVSVVTGYDATNFAAQPYMQGTGLGITTTPGADVVNGKVWYMSRKGLLEFNGDAYVPAALDLAEFTGDYGVVECGRKVYVADRTVGSGGGQMILIYDSDLDGWVQFQTPFEVRSMCSVETSSVRNVYYGSRDGQIHYLTDSNTQDRDLPTGATPTDIVGAITTRRYGQFDSPSPSRMARGRLNQVDVEYSGPMSVEVWYYDQDQGMISNLMFTLPTASGTDSKSFSLRGMPSYAQGTLTEIILSTASTIRGLTGYYSEGRVSRL